MLLHHHVLPVQLTRKVAGLQETITDFDYLLLGGGCEEKVFASSTSAGNGGGADRGKQAKKISNEPGLAGLTTRNDSTSDKTKKDVTGNSSVRSAVDTDPSDVTGPGSDRKGDKMPGEDGITKVTDAIADAIDRVQADEPNNNDDADAFK